MRRSKTQYSQEIILLCGQGGENQIYIEASPEFLNNRKNPCKAREISVFGYSEGKALIDVKNQRRAFGK